MQTIYRFSNSYWAQLMKPNVAESYLQVGRIVDMLSQLRNPLERDSVAWLQHLDLRRKLASMSRNLCLHSTASTIPECCGIC